MQNKKLIIFILMVIIVLLVGVLIYTNLSNKKQAAAQTERSSVAIDSVRTAVIDSMQQVLTDKVAEATRATLSKPTPPIELYDLINLFTPDETMDYNLYNWNTAANKPTINWITDGVEMDSTEFYRAGEAVVVINQKVLECLGQTTYPCKWDIVLLGPRGGYTSFAVQSVLHQALEIMTIDELFKGHRIESKQIKHDEFSETFRVKFPNKKPIGMTIKWSCGSAGCSLSIKCETL